MVKVEEKKEDEEVKRDVKEPQDKPKDEEEDDIGAADFDGESKDMKQIFSPLCPPRCLNAALLVMFECCRLHHGTFVNLTRCYIKWVS